MIKKGKYLCYAGILLLLMICILSSIKKPEASGLVAMTKSDGTTLKYRNSNETVYMLEEFNYPTNQLRAVWVSAFVGDISAYTTEEAFKTELNGLLDNLETMGMNAMVFHLRTHNNALYNSDLNPLASWFANVNFEEFDPITWLIEECHNRGIEFHAWLNPYRITKNGDVNQFKAEAMDENNPGSNLDNCIQVDESIILDPGIPENREFIVDTCMEIIEKYDVDAIHFDDYFYISGADDTTTREKYNTNNLSVGDFRRQQVDIFIETLSKEMRAYNAAHGKTVQLGIAPSGIYKNGGYTSKPTYDANGNLTSNASNTSGFAHYDNYLYADTLKWINNEWIDYIMPQLYWATEHTNASFTELTRWWSWAVRYKKVNFYAGIGIYMALSPDSSSGAYWQKNENEVQRQLLYAGQFTEFSGACFYKYDYLLKTYNAVVAHGVDLISNDYWKKRVPAAVQKYYAPLVDEIAPTNVKYISTNKSITFDEVANSRGYMVYQVPKGTQLDKTNINHVYEYIQETSIQITDTMNYDYYVASVNLANETSEAVYINIDLSGTSIIDLINDLPEVITFDDIATVEAIRKRYDMLSAEEQALVTNISILIEREQQVKTLKAAEETLNQFIEKLDTHVKTNRVLPKLSNMTWSYKNESDANLYNITTGERLKNYLATKEITLILTLTDNSITISKEVNINIGYVGVNQTGLFYRNDPSCMNEDDDGAYDSTIENKWIGWSGHTVVIGNEILFIAYGNYLEITDPNNIIMTNWKSCAGVYVNKTNSDVSFYLTQAFESFSSNYDGYFIISDQGKIKTIATGFDTSVPVTLAKDEAIVIIRYLDGAIDGAPWAPVTKLTEGLDAYVDEAPTLTSNEKAAEFENKINNLPETITIDHEVIVNELMVEYTNLPEDVKTLITNYNKLENAYNTIQSIKQEIADAKNTAILEIENYVDINNYSESNQDMVKGYIKTAKTNISLANTLVEIEAIVTETKTRIDQIETLSSVLDAKTEYKEKLDIFVNELDYAETEIELIKSTLEGIKHSIDNATSVEQIIKLYNGYIQEVETNHKYLVAEIEKSTKELNELVLKGTNDAQKTYISKIANETIEHINTLVTKNAVQEYVFNVKDTLNMYISEINDKINEIVGYLSTDKNTDNQEVINLANTYIELISGVATTQEVDNLYNEYIGKKALISDKPVVDYTEDKTKAKEEINNYVNTLDYSAAELIEIVKLKETMFVEIDAYETKEEIDNALNKFKEIVNNYHVVLQTKINSILSRIDTYTSETKEVDDLIAATKTKVANAGTTEEVDKIFNSFDKEYEEMTKIDEPNENPSDNPTNPNVGCNTGCNVASVIYSFIIPVLACILVLFRRKTNIN